jgi:hypothetical protein
MSEQSTPAAEPGRVLIVGCDSGWRTYEPSRDGLAGELILPYPQGISGHDPQDMGVFGGVRIWSIRKPS